MGVRETLNRHPRTTSAVTALVVAVAVSFIVFQLTVGRRGGGSKAFYTTDDGQTWFVDDARLATPFLHNGRPALRVYLFRAGDAGKPFAAFVERSDPKAAGRPAPDGYRATEVKIANDPNAQWLPFNDPQADEITTPHPPPGTPANADIVPYFP